MATDFWGQTLQIGDHVSYMDRHYRQFCHGTIINLGEKQATIRTEMYQDHPTLKDQMGYGKTCRDYTCIIKEHGYCNFVVDTST